MQLCECVYSVPMSVCAFKCVCLCVCVCVCVCVCFQVCVCARVCINTHLDLLACVCVVGGSVCVCVHTSSSHAVRWQPGHGIVHVVGEWKPQCVCVCVCVCVCLRTSSSHTSTAAGAGGDPRSA